MRKALWSLSLASAAATAAVVGAFVWPSHAYNISLNNEASDLLHGKVNSPSTAQSFGLVNQDSTLIAGRGKAPQPPAPAPRGLLGGAGTTKLLVQNGNQPPVNVYITLPASSGLGGPTNVNQLIVTTNPNGPTIPITATNAQQGFFVLPTNTTVNITTTANSIQTFDGMNIAFLAPPQCPNGSFPNGVNQAEATLNPPQNGQQETVDISANTGANSQIEVKFRPDKGNKWNNGAGGDVDVEEIINSWVDVAGARDNNCNRSGVFAYQLTTCTGGALACSPPGPFCSTTTELCNIQRAKNAIGFGGQVTVIFRGPISPP